jgi:NADPH:quinone reductase-like Zn-dependent oxidoreductase
VLVRVAASPINPSDIGFIGGNYGAHGTAPAIPGFEGSGTVVAAGGGLFGRLLVGRRVAFASPQGGAWAEYVATPAMRCIPIPAQLPLDEAAILIVNPLTAIAFFDIAREGSHAAMVSNAAASALGRMIIRMAKALRVPVVNVVRRPEQVELLRSIGAEHVLGSYEEGFASRLRDVAANLRATLILDAVGGPELGQLVESAPVGSTIVAYASLSGQSSVFNQRTLIRDNKRIESFYLGHWAAQKGLWRTLRDVLKVRSLAATELRTTIRSRLPLSAAQEAVDAYRKDMSSGKILLVPEPPGR